MYHAVSRLNIIDSVPRKSSPGGGAQCEADAGPIVDTNRAIAQLLNRALDCRRDRRIFEGAGMHDERGAERSPQRIIRKINRALNIFDHILRRECCFGKETAKSLCVETDILTLFGVNACDQRPRELVPARLAEQFSSWMRGHKCLVTLPRAWIKSTARWNLSKHTA